MTYHKVYRIPAHRYGIAGFEELPDKYYLTMEDTEKLLGYGLKYIREKFDGEAITWKYLGGLIHLEDLEYRHVIPYTELPRYEIAYAYENWKAEFLSTTEFHAFCHNHGFIHPPILCSTWEPISVESVAAIANQKSKYNSEHVMEGVIIINETFGVEGKLINPQYDDTVENESRRNKRLRKRNELKDED